MEITEEYVKSKFYENESSKIDEFMHIYPKILTTILTNKTEGDKVAILEIGNRNYETMMSLLSISDDIFVYGIDIVHRSKWNLENRKKMIDKYADRFILFNGSQDNKSMLTDMCRHCQTNFGGFNLVIDDGSHKSSHVLTSFDVISAYMKEEGVYAVEDIECIYEGHIPEKYITEDFWTFPEDYHHLTLRKFISQLTDVVNRDFLQRAKLASYNKENNIPRRSAHTLGSLSILGRDDLISSYRVFTNCLVIYFGYNTTKPVHLGGKDPRDTTILF